MKPYLFGWANVRKFIIEINKMYSNGNSFYSKKRIESGLAFIIMEAGLIYWLCLNVHTLDVSSLLMWAGANALISGYNIRHIQNEKKEDQK